MTEFDPTLLRSAFGSYMTGVTIVTAMTDENVPVGFTANSFTSVSLDPPLLLVCPGKHLSSFDVFSKVEQFAVNVLAEGQERLSNRFATSGNDRFDGIAWEMDLFGSPLLDGSAASFSCQVHERIPAGDHIILLGKVGGFEQSGARGLGYCSTGYFSLGKERQSLAPARPGHNASAGVIVDCNKQILFSREGPVLRLPNSRLSERTGAREAALGLVSGISAGIALGQVYSIYDDPFSSEHLTYFLATSKTTETGAEHQYIPLSAIPYDQMNKAEAKMLARYATESDNKNFGLYVGDAESGEVHFNQVNHRRDE